VFRTWNKVATRPWFESTLKDKKLIERQPAENTAVLENAQQKTERALRLKESTRSRKKRTTSTAGPWTTTFRLRSEDSREHSDGSDQQHVRCRRRSSTETQVLAVRAIIAGIAQAGKGLSVGEVFTRTTIRTRIGTATEVETCTDSRASGRLTRAGRSDFTSVTPITAPAGTFHALRLLDACATVLARGRCAQRIRVRLRATGGTVPTRGTCADVLGIFDTGLCTEKGRSGQMVKTTTAIG